MAATEALVKFETERGEVALSRDVVRRYLLTPGARVDDRDIDLFIKLCLYQKLNPFLREVYLVAYGDQPPTMVVGWQVFLQRAEAHPAFDGYEVEVFDQDDKPYRGRAGQEISHATARVYRKDRQYPAVVTVLFDEYCVRNARGEPRASWAKIPATMIRKVALEQALRETFTKEYQGLYGPEEMGVVEALPTEPVHQPREVAAQVVDISAATEVKSPEKPEEPEPPEDTPVAVVPPRNGFAARPAVTPFAVVKHLADLYGAGWTRATIAGEPATKAYFGQDLRSARDMDAFAKANPEAWNTGAAKVVEAARRKRERA